MCVKSFKRVFTTRLHSCHSIYILNSKIWNQSIRTSEVDGLASRCSVVPFNVDGEHRVVVRWEGAKSSVK